MPIKWINIGITVESKCDIDQRNEASSIRLILIKSPQPSAQKGFSFKVAFRMRRGEGGGGLGSFVPQTLTLLSLEGIKKKNACLAIIAENV